MNRAIDLDRSGHLEYAVQVLARMLLPGAGEDMEPALASLLAAFDVDAVVLDRVEFDLHRGAVLVPIAQARRRGIRHGWVEFVLEPELEQYTALMRGEVWAVSDTLAPDAPDREKYAELDPAIRAELAVPIVDDGTPVGLLSFIQAVAPRRWSEPEFEALATASSLIKAVWSRSRATDLEALGDRRRSFLVTEALLACSQALLLESDSSAVDRALKTVLTASEAAIAYIDENVADPELGLLMVNRYSARGERLADGVFKEFFEPNSWESMPSEYAALEGGGMWVVDGLIPQHSESPSAWNAIQAEIAVPISVDGEWRFTIGMVDVVPRVWTTEQRRLVETVAAMFGAYWTRETVETRLRHTLESRDQFVASVSHELRTPLAGMVGFASELRDAYAEFDEETRLELIRLIARQAGDVSYLVDDLLVAARSQQSSLSLVPSIMDVESEIKQTLAGLPPEYAEGVEVSSDGVHLAFADARRVRQIIRNLVVNARKYGGPSCLVTLSRQGQFEVVEVRDNGPGIPVPLRASMFDAYQSGMSSADPLPSIGLGLTVSRQLAEMMDGSLEYHFDGWSAFALRLPVKWSLDVVE